MSDTNSLVSPDQTEEVEQVADAENLASEAATEEQSQETEQNEEETEGEKPKEKPWFVKRLERQRAQLAEKERQLAIAQQLLEATQSASADPEQQQQSPAQQQRPLTEKDVDERAKAIVAETEFNNRCNDAFSEGIKAYGQEFGEGIAALRDMGIIAANPQGRLFIEAALDTGKAHAVLHHLAQNPDDADRIATLSPTKMAIEMDRIARGNAASAKPVSKAPPPVKPLTRPVKVEEDPEKMSVEQWLEWRNRTKTIR